MRTAALGNVRPRGELGEKAANCPANGLFRGGKCGVKEIIEGQLGSDRTQDRDFPALKGLEDRAETVYTVLEVRQGVWPR